ILVSVVNFPLHPAIASCSRRSLASNVSSQPSNSCFFFFFRSCSKLCRTLSANFNVFNAPLCSFLHFFHSCKNMSRRLSHLRKIRGLGPSPLRFFRRNIAPLRGATSLIGVPN